VVFATRHELVVSVFGAQQAAAALQQTHLAIHRHGVMRHVAIGRRRMHAGNAVADATAVSRITRARLVEHLAVPRAVDATNAITEGLVCRSHALCRVEVDRNGVLEKEEYKIEE
jgi:hypothetical protein